jgi:hypothetical protein
MISERNKSADDVLDMLSSWLNTGDNESDSNQSDARWAAEVKFNPRLQSKSSEHYNRGLDPFTEGRLMNMQLLKQQEDYDSSIQLRQTFRYHIESDKVISEDKSDEEDNSVVDPVSSHRGLVKAKSKIQLQAAIQGVSLNDLKSSASKEDMQELFESLLED